MIPSLAAICIHVLLPYPDRAHHLPVTLVPRPAVLRDLVPDPADVDPRLWALLAQIYRPLPAYLARHTADLHDPRLPLLQAIPSTPSFSLVTVLTLPESPALTDAAVPILRHLHTLAALDASNTSLSTHAIASLAAALHPADLSSLAHKGPWPLRILFLRNCLAVDNDIYPHLQHFPLLSVVDLRGTCCTVNPLSPFQPSDRDALYYPSPLADALALLESNDAFYSSPTPFKLTVVQGRHPSPRPCPAQPSTAPEDVVVTLPANPLHSVQVINSHVLEQQIQRDQPVNTTPRTSISISLPRHTIPSVKHSIPSTDLPSFYRPPQPPKRTTPVSRALRNAQYEATRHDASLRLYRDPPPWAALEQALVSRRKQQIESKQCRQLSLVTAKHSTATVDHASHKAERARESMRKALNERVQAAQISSCDDETRLQPAAGGNSISLPVLRPVQTSSDGGSKARRNPFCRSAIEPLKSRTSVDSRIPTTSKPLPPLSLPTAPSEKRRAQFQTEAAPAAQITSRSNSPSGPIKKSPKKGHLPREGKGPSCDTSSVESRSGFDWKGWGK